MEVIKVVHAETDAEVSENSQAFALESYKFDADDFLNRDGSRIRTWVERLTDIADNVNPLHRGAMKIAGKLLSAGGASKDTVAALDVSRMEARRLAMTVSASVVDDIRDQLKRVKVLSLNAAKLQYPRTSNLSVGTYTLHPYDSGRLTRLESYHISLAMEKDHELVILLGRMGAKNIRIIELGTNSAALNSSIGLESIPADIAGRLSVKSQSASGNDLFVSFEGNAVKVDEELLKTSLWFSTDSQLYSILASRRFNPNKIDEYTLKSTYRETFDFDFDLAARFTALSVDVKAQFQSVSQKERLFHVEFAKS